MLGWTVKLSVQLKTELIYSVLEKVKSCLVTGLISLSRSSTGKELLLIYSVFRYVLAGQSGLMSVFPLCCHMSMEGSWSPQWCLTGISKTSWHIVLWCLLKCITKTNGENLVHSENMKVEPPIQLFSFMLNRHWIQFEVKHFVHKHIFLQQALKIDFYTNYRVFTATQMTCQVNFSLMFPLHDLGWGGEGMDFGGWEKHFYWPMVSFSDK